LLNAIEKLIIKENKMVSFAGCPGFFTFGPWQK